MPVSSIVHVNLLGTVLNGDGTTIAGQSNNPVSKDVDPNDVKFSAKKGGFFDENEELPKSYDPWE